MLGNGVAARIAGSAPSYLYHFSYVPAASRAKVRGATHGAEIPYVFDSWDQIPGSAPTAEMREVTRVMHGCWVAFARTGIPRCEGAPPWPRYTARGDRLMEFGAAPVVRTHFRRPQLDAQDSATVQREQAQAIAERLEHAPL